MKLKAVVDSLDSVDEAHRDFYVAFDDNGTERFRLDVEGLPSHPEAQSLKGALDRTRARIRELDGQIKGLEEKYENVPDDFDPELYERAVTEGVGGSGSLPNEDDIRKQAAEAAKKKAEAEFEKERKKLTDERDRLLNRVQRDTKRVAINEALDQIGVTDPAYRKAARALIGEDVIVKFDEESGEYVALAHDEALGDIPVIDRAKSWAADEGKAFIGPQGSGGGGASGDGQGGSAGPQSNSNPWKTDTMNVSEQARIRREDPDKARTLAVEAGLKPTW